MRRGTLARAVERRGPGVHTGVEGVVRLEPAAFGEGLVVHAGGAVFPADLHHARAVPGATQLVCGDVVVGTPEHLLAALRGMGVTDTHIYVSGPEVPVLDGSALAWCAALEVIEGPELVLASVPPGRVEAHGGWMAWAPGEPEVVVEVDFGPSGPRGRARWAPGDDFAEEVGWARTFVLADQVEALRAAGRGKGATADNTLVWGEGVPRRAGEPVAHKLLDLIGDLALAPALGMRVEVGRGSHRLHLEGLAAMLG